MYKSNIYFIQGTSVFYAKYGELYKITSKEIDIFSIIEIAILST